LNTQHLNISKHRKQSKEKTSTKKRLNPACEYIAVKFESGCEEDFWKFFGNFFRVNWVLKLTRIWRILWVLWIFWKGTPWLSSFLLWPLDPSLLIGIIPASVSLLFNFTFELLHRNSSQFATIANSNRLKERDLFCDQLL